MKYFLSLFLIIIYSTLTFSQIKIVEPKYHYNSKFDYEGFLSKLEIGNKSLFRQNCTEKLPPDVTNGIVYFENVHFNEDRFSMAIEFVDTVLTSMVITGKTKKTTALLSKMGFSNMEVKQLFDSKKWTNSIFRNNVYYSFYGDKRNVTIVARLKSEE